MAGKQFKACAVDDIGEKAVKSFMIDGRPIALAKYEGSFYAIDDLCTHDGGDLSEGDVIKGEIQCPRHGARFSLLTGQATRMPAVEDIKTYKINLENGFVYILIDDEN